MWSPRWLGGCSGQEAVFSSVARRSQRWLSATTAAPQTITIHPRHQDYYRSLLKKLMFVVHPDFFTKQKAMQEVNSKNLRFLQSVVQSAGQPVALPHNTRTLNFFIKPTEPLTEPRKVKISISRLHESIGDVLDALGVSVPPLPHDLSHSHKVSASRNYEYEANYGDYDASRSRGGPSADTLFLLRFLDSLAERKDLIVWKEERMALFNQYKHQMINLSGLKDIAFQNSWSTVNNVLLLQRLLQDLMVPDENGELRSHISSTTVKKLLAGMTLVVHCDAEKRFHVVDHIERKIFFDCSQPEPSIAWVQMIITLSRLSALETDRIDLDRVDAMVATVEDALVGSIFAWTGQRMRVELRKGFTCTQRGFLHFLRQAHRAVGFHGAGAGALQLGDDTDSYLSLMDLNGPALRVIVEHNHGTKLLPSGDFRVDVECQWIQMQAFMQTSITVTLEKLQEHRRHRLEVESRERAVTDRLGLRSITVGLGITDAMYYRALNTIHGYLMCRHPLNRGVLKHLRGMHVRVGLYTGVADDGACVLPWDCELIDV